MSRKLRHILKLTLTLALLLLILSWIDMKLAFVIISKANTTFLVLLVLFLVLNRVLMAWRWNLLTKAKGIKLNIWNCLKIYLMSNFAGLFLPSSVGGDLYRIYSTYKRVGQASIIAASVVLERFIGMFTRVLAATAGLTFILIDPEFLSLDRNAYIIVISLSTLFVGGFLFSFHGSSTKLLYRVTHQWKDNRLVKKILQFQEAYIDYKKSGMTLLGVFLFSVMGVLLVSAANYFAGMSIGINIGLIYYFALVPLINLIGRIPITVNGIGVVEGAYVLFFTQFGVSTTQAFTLAVLLRLVRFIFPLIGGLFYLQDSSPSGSEIELLEKEECTSK